MFYLNINELTNISFHYFFFSSDILSCTHCLCKTNKFELLPVPLKALADRKLHCLPAVYLSDFLMNDPPPDVKSCYFEEYKRLLQML